MTDRRIGKFYIDLGTINGAPHRARAILRDVIVTMAHYAGEERICYVGLHPSFEVLPVGVDPVLYEADVTFEDRAGGFVTHWKRIEEDTRMHENVMQCECELEGQASREQEFAQGSLTREELEQGRDECHSEGRPQSERSKSTSKPKQVSLTQQRAKNNVRW